MELLLKKSQVSMLQIQAAMSKYFDVERKVKGGYEWVGGDLRQMPGVGRQDPEDEAWVFARVPYADKEKRTLVTRVLSPFAGTLYRIRLHNVDLPTTLAVVKELQGIGVDVGFAEPSIPDISWGDSPYFAAYVSAEEFDWPASPQAELSKAEELHRLYEERRLSKARRSPRPYQLCGGMPSGWLCGRCAYNTLKGGEDFCFKYKIAAGR